MSKSKQLESTAYHEAGHAVAHFVMNRPVKQVSIIPKDDTLGHCQGGEWPTWFNPETDPVTWRVRRWIDSEIISLFAGGIAEAKFRGRRNHVGANQDLHLAIRLAECVCGCSTKELESYLNWLHVRADGIFDQQANWKAVEAIAACLLERHQISGKTAKLLFQQVANPQPEVAYPQPVIASLQSLKDWARGIPTDQEYDTGAR